MNLADTVRINALNRGGEPAIRCADTTLSYLDAWTTIEALAAELHEAGVRDGDRVGLAMKDHPKHLLAHYAVARLSAVIVPIDHRWTNPEKAAAATTFATRLVVADDNTEIAGVRTVTLSGTASELSSELPPWNRSADQPLLISLSSGTTGKPKGAIVTHENLYERFVSQWTAIGFGSRDCFALLTPLYFGAGRSFGLCLLAAGGTVHIAPPPMSPEQIVAVVKSPSISATFLPPTLLRRLLPLAGDAPLLPNLQYLLVSGEPLYAAEAAECRQKISPNLIGYYASSEGGGISVLTSSEFREHSATVGKPTFRTEVEIVDGDGQLVQDGTVGRLRYRGPGVATRFVDSEGHEHAAEAGGWFYPGDLAEKLPTGHLALRGRDKDVIIRGGVNVYPAEVESVLLQHGSVSECSVVGFADSHRGQLVVACIVDDPAVNDDALAEFCKERLAPYKVPSAFVRFAELPKSNSGKIDKKMLTLELGENIT
ncbi:MAG: class I adenylate-forming enzyme family protein [Pseudomonadota bacterium]